MLAFMVVGFSAFFFLRAYVDPAMPWFSVQHGAVSFDAASYEGDGDVTVPASILDQPVNALADSCFMNCTGITSVTVSEGIQRIGSYAFANTSGLRSVTLPDSVTEVGMAAFFSCVDLEAVSIPGSVGKLDSSVFMNSPNLQYIFFRGTAAQWEAVAPTTLPKDATVYLVQGDSYQEYIPG